MKLILVFALLQITALYAQENYRCYSQLCIPQIDQGNNLFSPLHNQQDQEDLNSMLRQKMGISSSKELNFEWLAPQSAAEKEAKEDTQAYLLNLAPFFPEFVGTSFNSYANFSGPNCYNTALLSSGILPSKEVRYVSLREFEQFLETFYIEHKEVKARDIVLFDAKSTRSHAAFYLYDGLIFHKKGYTKKYNYRIVPLQNVDKVEEGEWVPGPMDDIRYPLDEKLNEKPMAFFALKKELPNIKKDLSKDETNFIHAISYITDQLLQNAANWKVGKEMGVISEDVLSDLGQYFYTYSRSEKALLKLFYARIESLRDQINLSIRESHFSSRFAREDKIYPEICFKDNKYLRGLIAKLMTLFDKTKSQENFEQVMKDLQATDTKACRFSLVKSVLRL